ncbi:BTAD domain-containing putative transcriptional regulator [Spongisporangium articulatum]|uniref:BTAD domain-containing putative transcriptional regulator n=1 Tax=Spongisporangium articulatum TaxID=3362603 RepID=A0ABW8AJ74_9ACTN
MSDVMDVLDITATPARVPAAAVRLFGVPRIDPGGEITGRRAQLCLAKLASPPGRIVPRDRLADVIWEDRLPKSWQAALRNVIAEVRAACTAAGLGPAAVESAGTGYRLSLPTGVGVDVEELTAAATRAEDAVRAGDPTTAAASGVHLGAATRDVPLAGLDGDWVERTRRATVEAVTRLALAVGEASLALDDVRRAEELGRLLVRLAPLREDGYRLQMRALLESGNRAEALRVYEACRALLAEELGTAPSESTRALMTSLLSDEHETPRAPAALTPAATGGGWRRALRYGLAAARTSWEARVYEDTAAMARRALDVLAAAGDPDPAGRRDLQILYGGALRVLGDPAGTELLHRVWEEARETGDPDRMADAALAFSEEATGSDESHLDDDLVGLFQETYDAVWPGEMQRRTRLLGHIAVGRTWLADGFGGRRAARNALVLARSAEDPALLMSVLTTARRTLTGAGLPLEQAGLEDELEGLAERFDDPSALTRVALWRFLTRMESGDGAGLEGLLETAAEHASGLRSARVQHQLAYSRAAVAVLHGDLAAAEALTEEATASGHALGLPTFFVEGIRLVLLATVREHQGRLSELAPALTPFDSPALPEHHAVAARAELARVLTEGAGGTDLQQAAQAVDGYLDLYTRSGPTMVNPVAQAAGLAGTVARLGEEARARRLYDLLSAHAGTGAVYTHLARPVDHALGLLAGALGDNALAADHFATGARFARRLGAPLWVERCERDAAAL